MRKVIEQDKAATVTDLIAVLTRMHEAGACYATNSGQQPITVYLLEDTLSDGSKVTDVVLR